MSGQHNDFKDGDRLGKFVLLHDRDGALQALSAGAVMAACETDSGTVLLLPGGRMVGVSRPSRTVLSWLKLGKR